MKHSRLSLVVLPGLCIAGEARALAGFSYGGISLNAFGMPGGARLSNEHPDGRPGSRAAGSRLAHAFDFELDSRLGAQFNLVATRSTPITAPTAAEPPADNRFMQHLPPANLGPEAVDNLAVSRGRIQNPLLPASDYRLSGFPTPWMRPPGALYNRYPVTLFDINDHALRLRLNRKKIDCLRVKAYGPRIVKGQGRPLQEPGLGKFYLNRQTSPGCCSLPENQEAPNMKAFFSMP